MEPVETFNRTRVECKSFFADMSTAYICAFNRTRVECKFTSSPVFHSVGSSPLIELE